MLIVNKIMLLLDERGLNQKDLMDYLGLEKSTFSSWKAGKSRSYKKYIAEIAEFFGVSTDYLLGITDDPIDYENSPEFLNAPLDVIKHFNNDAKKIYEFQKAVANDAVSANMIYEPADDIKIVARHLEDVPIEKRKELVDNINRTIDMYLKAIGYDIKGG